ncbi:SDR family oxidoreductase [Staphylococcus equorum]|uniref:SDR family oxidoreductase n=1 Tax=Staphylococcus equorum TaxID=246432 RepID=A0A9X4L7C3_9STAP|nr:SDR family oxidoreductase [Staphylococcus equorum]MDG0842066.1 SDR family oxidoreductase [Staphylococcus equorum]MDG0857883.1 SDR family oxidoreductase [Staphylococcus equorum]
MKVGIIGAHGNIGLRLGTILTDLGVETVGFIRKEEQASKLESMGVKPEFADIIDTPVDEYSKLLQGIDALVFSAGAGGAGEEITKKIDGEGVEKMIKAAKNAGVKRFILVSAFPDALRDENMPASFEFYMKMKRKADVDLVNSGLNWTIIRPGTLTDEPGKGHVTIGSAIEYGDVSRDNVAAVIVELLNNDETSQLILELTDGNVPIKEAVENQRRPLE